MGKRFQRISGRELPDKQALVTAGPVQVVLRSGQTYLGQLSFPDPQTVLVVTQRNVWFRRRDQEHHIPLTDIEEVIVDRITDW